MKCRLTFLRKPSKIRLWSTGFASCCHLSCYAKPAYTTLMEHVASTSLSTTLLTLTIATYSMAISKNGRPCIQCGRLTTSPVYCLDCYQQTPAGRLERAMKARYRTLPNGGPCAACMHWKGSCGLGLPEGGSKYAQDCSLLLLQKESCAAIHS